ALAEAFTLCDAYHCSVMGPTWPNRLYWMTGAIDPEGKAGGPVTSNKAPPEGFRWTTYAERLEAAGVDWGIYQYGAKGNRHYNMLQEFKQFREAPADSPLRVRGMPDADEEKFASDVLHDRLRTVSWMFPPTGASEHPDHLPAAGADFIARRLNELA